MHDGSDFILKNTEISYQRRILPIFCLENGGIMFLRNASFFFFSNKLYDVKFQAIGNFSGLECIKK